MKFDTSFMLLIPSFQVMKGWINWTSRSMLLSFKIRKKDWGRYASCVLFKRFKRQSTWTVVVELLHEGSTYNLRTSVVFEQKKIVLVSWYRDFWFNSRRLRNCIEQNSGPKTFSTCLNGPRWFWKKINIDVLPYHKLSFFLIPKIIDFEN